VRTRRFETLSTQDIVQYVVVGLLSGCFWWQRAGHDTLSATQDTLGMSDTLPFPNHLQALHLPATGVLHKNTDLVRA
jgi:hypothetical protein